MAGPTGDGWPRSFDLVFAAADVTNIDAARQNARRERAWQSILTDADLRENLTRAQASDAETQARRSRNALLQSVRSAWVHVLHPAPPEGEDSASNAGLGYVMHSTRLINRGGAKSIPQAVWDKVSTDGTVIAEMGPQNLARSLEPVWPADQPHIPIEKIRHWFTSYVYMPRLRDDATLNGALQRLVKDLVEPYVYASSFDEVAGTYDGAIEGIVRLADDRDGGLLVRREAAKPPPVPPPPPPPPPPPNPRRRFFASIQIEPERAGLEVARTRRAHPLAGIEPSGHSGDPRCSRGAAIPKTWSTPSRPTPVTSSSTRRSSASSGTDGRGFRRL